MDYHFFVGIDVSKLTLDCTLLRAGEFIEHSQIENRATAISAWLLALKKGYGAGGKKTLFCVEKTGAYDRLIIAQLAAKKLALWVENPLQIQRSLGIVRGKNDRVDSMRIAIYGYVHRHKAALWKAPRDVLVRLRHLRSLRNRLMTAILMLEQPLREVSGYETKSRYMELATCFAQSLSALKADFKDTNRAIAELIATDLRLAQLFGWITSVRGVGPVLATEILITTNEFLDFTSPKKFACYCGVIPFERQSGTSVKGKTRVSFLSNRRMKKLLHLAALAAMRDPGEIRNYFDRKVAEGKSKMSVLNSIRNKIVHRVFACVKGERFYQCVLPK